MKANQPASVDAQVARLFAFERFWRRATQQESSTNPGLS